MLVYAHLLFGESFSVLVFQSTTQVDILLNPASSLESIQIVAVSADTVAAVLRKSNPWQTSVMSSGAKLSLQHLGNS